MGILHSLRRARAGGWLLFAVVALLAIVQSASAEKLQNIENENFWTTHNLFQTLFPSPSPATNALLATAYISIPPNLLLALLPRNIDPSTLSIMVAFAVGGLLGDTFFHLMPEIFLGEGEAMVRVEPKRNLLLGFGIVVGFITFVGVDKAVRILNGGEGHEHGHGHAHGREIVKEEGSPKGERKRAAGGAAGKVKKEKSEKSAVALKVRAEKTESSNTSVKLGGLLNMIADFTHNITDGLALAASFYASPTVGATTAVAIFFHEIPHEVGDFALLVQSGFSKWQAMGAQFITAVGALAGTIIGIAIQEYGGSTPGEGVTAVGEGIFGTSLQWGDMLLPFTAGTFLYVGTVAAIPELLETGSEKAKEARRAVMQFLAVAAGAGIMLFISWQE